MDPSGAQKSLCLAAGCFLAAFLLCCLSGCTTTRGPEDSDLPWATQESWEGSPAMPGGIGAPGLGGAGGGGL